MADNNDVKVTGSSANKSDDTLKLFSAYDAVCHAEEQLDSIEKDIENAIPKKIDICKIQEILMTLDKIQNALIDVQNVMTSSITNILSSAVKDVMNLANESIKYAQNVVNEAKDKAVEYATDAVENAESKAESKVNQATQLMVDAKYLKYLAVQIILKKFQILKYRIDLIKNEISIMIAKLTKMVLSGILVGKGSVLDPINKVMSSVMASAAAAVNSVLTIIDAIVTMINSTVILNVNGGCMTFFQTPKSIIKADMIIANSHQSTTNSIPDPINEMISEAENKIRTANGAIKKGRIIAMAAAGAASAVGGDFEPGSFGNIPKFDPSIIREAIMMIIQLLTDAEALPRYEKLSITNIRFLTFLVTGFEPAGKRTFGIPGFP